MFKEQKGITLVALVITIIVLLILAGVSIAMLTGDNGILNKSKDAVAESQIAEDKEAAALDLNAAYTAYMDAKYVKGETVTTFKAYLTANKTTLMTDTKHYIFNDEAGTITTVKTNKSGKTETATIADNGGLVTPEGKTTPWSETSASK